MYLSRLSRAGWASTALVDSLGNAANGNLREQLLLLGWQLLLLGWRGVLTSFAFLLRTNLEMLAGVQTAGPGEACIGGVRGVGLGGVLGDGAGARLGGVSGGGVCDLSCGNGFLPNASSSSIVESHSSNEDSSVFSDGDLVEAAVMEGNFSQRTGRAALLNDSSSMLMTGYAMTSGGGNALPKGGSPATAPIPLRHPAFHEESVVTLSSPTAIPSNAPTTVVSLSKPVNWCGWF